MKEIQLHVVYMCAMVPRSTDAGCGAPRAPPAARAASPSAPGRDRDAIFNGCIFLLHYVLCGSSTSLSRVVIQSCSAARTRVFTVIQSDRDRVRDVRHRAYPIPSKDAPCHKLQTVDSWPTRSDRQDALHAGLSVRRAVLRARRAVPVMYLLRR